MLNTPESFYVNIVQPRVTQELPPMSMCGPATGSGQASASSIRVSENDTYSTETFNVMSDTLKGYPKGISELIMSLKGSTMSCGDMFIGNAGPAMGNSNISPGNRREAFV